MRIPVQSLEARDAFSRCSLLCCKLATISSFILHAIRVRWNRIFDFSSNDKSNISIDIAVVVRFTWLCVHGVRRSRSWRWLWILSCTSGNQFSWALKQNYKSGYSGDFKTIPFVLNFCSFIAIKWNTTRAKMSKMFVATVQPTWASLLPSQSSCWSSGNLLLQIKAGLCFWVNRINASMVHDLIKLSKVRESFQIQLKNSTMKSGNLQEFQFEMISQHSIKYIKWKWALHTANQDSHICTIAKTNLPQPDSSELMTCDEWKSVEMCVKKASWFLDDFKIVIGFKQRA